MSGVNKAQSGILHSSPIALFVVIPSRQDLERKEGNFISCQECTFKCVCFRTELAKQIGKKIFQNVFLQKKKNSNFSDLWAFLSQIQRKQHTLICIYRYVCMDVLCVCVF